MIDPKNISKLGFGTVKFGRNTGVKYPGGEGFALPTPAQMESLLDLVLDLGINLLDTAPAYGTSEERLGVVLGARRDKFFLVTKSGEEFDGQKSEYIFTAAHTRMSVERSLTRLKTDYLDCVLLHCNRPDIDAIAKTDAMGVLADMKREGKIRYFGASSHSIDGGIAALDMSDCAMVAFNAGYTDERAVIDHAAKTGKMIFIKKALSSGHSADPAADLRFVASTAGVTSVVVGSLNPANILSNIKALDIS